MKMNKYYIYLIECVGSEVVMEVYGDEAAAAAYMHAEILADMTESRAILVSGETGEVLKDTDEDFDSPPDEEFQDFIDDNLEWGFDPYMGCYTDDC